MRLLKDQQGAAFLEFLVAFVPLWIFFLCMVQLAFISNANIMVKHAADAAARSAIVVLPDDPAFYNDEAEHRVDGGLIDTGDATTTLGTMVTAIYDAVLQGGTGTIDKIIDALKALGNNAVTSVFGSRGSTIKVAAHVPLMPLAPQDFFDSDPSIKNSFASATSSLKSFGYNPFAVSVEFPNVDGEKVTTPEITVRVNYKYRCSVPVARKIVCGDSLEGTLGTVAGLFMGGRYKEIQHESTLLIHDAPYNYKEEE